jgi:voltage-gated potassium channel Kch
MTGKIRQLHFIWLTIALIGILLMGALTKELPEVASLQALEYMSIILMLLSLGSLRKNRRWVISLVMIIGLTLMVVVARDVTKIQYFEYTYLLLLLVFFMSAAWLVGSQVLLTGSVDINIVVGSIALYLILGMIWSIFYTVLLAISPEAMEGVVSGSWHENMYTMTYFSYVTLTTLGYGDISPITPVAQVLVILEAATGVFYMAIVVASLIGGIRRNWKRSEKAE